MSDNSGLLTAIVCFADCSVLGYSIVKASDKKLGGQIAARITAAAPVGVS